MKNIESDIEWQVQKVCTDIDGYELVIEKQKQHLGCSQKSDTWKWLIAYHGSIAASGLVHSFEEAKLQAVSNVPE